MEEEIANSIKGSLKEKNIDLLGVKLGEEDGVKTLFITIDSELGVDTSLCENAMKIVSPIIDSLNLDLNEYVLDVCSKGEEL